ncbi:MAG: type II toxin-antitoxin system RelE/ParE family toxin [Candidatus Omnitrophica bacterium]|nr:type II toxin-antitoxin system RelE/ParE family toxin [Candidatus Omnitrophota bacterium]
MSAPAELDLEDIELQTFDLFGVHQAIQTMDAFDKAVDLIAENPRIGRSREDLSPKERSLRSWPILGRFLIVYEIKDDIVYIDRILDGTRDLASLYRKWHGTES